MPFPRDPRQPPPAANKGTDKLEAPQTKPLKPEDGRAFGKDQFTASAALRFGVSGPQSQSRDVDAGKVRIRELHEELARAKATILEVRPRMAILKRAMRLNDGKVPEAALFHINPLSEQRFTRQVAIHLASSTEAARVGAIATGQYESAWEAMRAVEEALTDAEMGPAEEVVAKLAGLSVEKMRRQVFPLLSLYVHFENDQVLTRLFPPPHLMRPRGTAKLDPKDVPPYANSPPPEPYTLSDLFRPTVRRIKDALKGGDGEKKEKKKK